MSEISNIQIENNEYSLKDNTARTKISGFITPEQFGAKGDSITDDTTALINMINYIDSTVGTRSFINESSCKDYSKINIVFGGKYLVSSPIIFNNVYGLNLIGLKLIASNTFTGSYLLGFTNPNRQINMDNCYLNGSLKVNTCLHIEGYTLGFKINNTEITRFKEYGIYTKDKGHEMIIVNTKINQVEWGEKDSLDTLVTTQTGTGLYLGDERYDNHFTNLIINYCKKNLVMVKSSANYFNTCHFYGSPVELQGNYNYMNDCYFDTTLLKMFGFNYIKGCTFSGRGVEDNFIEMTDSEANMWSYDYSTITNCVFRCEEPTMLNPIKLNSMWSNKSNFSIQTLNNSFYNVQYFDYPSYYERFPAPWKALQYTGDSEAGSFIIGDLLVQFGTITEAGYVELPVDYNEYLIDVVIVPEYAGDDRPFANTKTNTGFYANIQGKSKWIAFGRMQY